MSTTEERAAAPETPPETTLVLPATVDSPVRFRPGAVGVLARGVGWAVLVWLVLAVPGNIASPFELGAADVSALSLAAIYGIVGLSLNVLIGYAGQISFGHQAFVGLGAFTSAYVVTDLHIEFWLALPIAAALSGLQAAVLGAISLRLTGLYFALVTLAYGLFAEETLFGIAGFTGGEGGKDAPRPMGFDDDHRYYYLCLGFLAVVLWLDWRLTRSKGGRALQALRENPRVAASFGIDVKAYILLAFATSGVFAGVAGSLFAHNAGLVVPSKFGFELALVFVLMTVVGGLRSRSGVVIGSAFFALMGTGKLVEFLNLEGFVEGTIGLPKDFVGLVVGPVLLLLTITLFPGGIGQQIAPVREWLLGRRFDVHAGKVREVEVTDVRA
ncbi:branched-chain amino acid ABC transporter permease [Actinophytocola sp. NPDC049390]|uniref:branched-chain amino acid ABC transporter permease n=1 Tax=Actinophytocola sp. NPDC049390 TaxID=3363894 RepID=UPI0037B097FD